MGMTADLGFDPFYLWVDAPCINQNDDAEKSRQVQMMGQIYSGPDLVICWLGLASSDSDLAIEKLKLLKPLFGVTELQKSLESTTASFDSRTRDAILLFSKRSYWKRVWILQGQELFIARKHIVIYGSKVITDDELHAGLNASRVFSKLCASGFSELVKKTPAVWQVHAKFLGFHWLNGLDRLLSVCSQEEVEATEPRDYIYAYLSVSWDGANGLLTIIPGYDKPVRTVFYETMGLLVSSNAVPLELRRLGHRGEMYRHPVGPHFRGLAKKMGILDEDLEEWFVKKCGLDGEHGATAWDHLPTETMETNKEWMSKICPMKVHDRLLLLSARGQR